MAPMSVTWTKLAAKPVSRPSKWIGEIDVGRMQGGGVRVVQEVDVVLVDARIVRIRREDVLDRLRGARQVVQEADAADHQAAIRLVERRHQVVSFIRDRRARHVLERDDRLVHDAVQLVSDDLEGDGINAG
jgi:predicted membrane GTPase involved in stress response